MPKLYFTSVLMLTLFSAASVWGQSPSTSTTQAAPSGRSNPDTVILRFEGLAQTASEQLKQSTGGEISDQGLFQLSLKSQQKNIFESSNQAKLSLFLQSLNNKKDLMIAIPEAYIDFGADQKIGLGRKIKDFSAVDRMLNLAVISPTLTTDNIRSQQQGLMGVHFEKQMDEFRLDFSIVGLYLPSQSPGVREQNGQLIQSNRWASSPPKTMRDDGELKDIIYKIKDTDIGRIVDHQGVLLGAGWQAGGSAIKASVGRIPVNDLVISRDIFGDLEFQPYVNLTPVVIYQDVFAADFSFPAGNIQTTLGLMQSIPENKAPVARYESQRLTSSTTYALILEYPIENSSDRIVDSLSLTVAETRGGGIDDIDAEGNPADFIISPQRFKFNKPIQVQSQLTWWRQGQQKLSSDFKFIYDREQKGSLVDANIAYVTSIQGLSTQAGVTVLGVSEQNEDDKRFLYQLQANDRIYGGMSYEF